MKKLLMPGFIAAIAIVLVSVVLSFVFNYLSPSINEAYRLNPVFRSWTDPLMYLYYLHPLLLGYVLAWVWLWAKDAIPGGMMSTVFRFALAYWLVASLPGMLMTFSSFKLPFIMVLSWTVTSFFHGLAAAIVYSKMLK